MGIVDSGQSMVRPTTTARPLSFQRIREQASADESTARRPAARTATRPNADRRAEVFAAFIV
jgi:hypothetical protein